MKTKFYRVILNVYPLRSFMKTATLTKFLIGFVLIATLFTLQKTHLNNYLKLEYIQQHQEALKQLITNNSITAGLVYIALYAAAIVCMLSFTLLLTAYSGFLFGAFNGTLLSLVGSLIGCSLSFFAIRYLLYNWLHKKYHNSVEKFSKKFKEHGVLYLLTLYFFPLTPYALITTLAGLSDISYITFLWTTALGILPITIICAYTGEKIATVTTLKDILSGPLFIALIVLSLLTLVPVLVKTKKNNPGNIN